MSTEGNQSWWQSGIFYNLYVRSFKDSNADGIGDLTGVIDKLEYLGDTLGVNVIWLSGILMGPWREYGFDVSDFTNIHPAFGTLETFDELLRQAHARGMYVIIDFVPNHTSSEHRWFLESRATRRNPKRDWYVWRDPKRDGTPPNNWLSLFGGSSWEWDENTWQYYLHSFLKEQPDLNWRNPEVQQAMFDQARFWLERGVDGFRVDAAHHIMKDPRLRNNPGGAKPRLIGGKKLAHEYQEHEYDKEHPDLHRVYRDFRRLLEEYGAEQPRAAFAEVHTSGGWNAWCAYYGQALDEFHFPLNPAFISLPWDAQRVRQVIGEIEAALPPGAWPNYHIGNFDEWRVVTRYGPLGARAAALLLLTLRGTPLIYFGEEIGMTNVPIPPEYERDPMGKRVGLNRDPQRTPMQWTPEPYAGFSAHTTSKLWLPVSSNYRQVNVETELVDPRSMLSLYRTLIAARRDSPALLYGSYQPLDQPVEAVFAFLRELGEERLLVVVNFVDEPRRVSLTGCGRGEVLLNTYLDRDGDIDLEGFDAGAYEGLLIRLKGNY